MAELVKKGGEGEEVRALQDQLVKLGYGIEVDGKFGPVTEWAVRNLQAMFGYDIDGIVGPGTRKLIDAQLSYGWNATGEGAQAAALKAQGLKA
jgi:peptidoglycan hydrolase-like protein with peptidoglycan-binding domain